MNLEEMKKEISQLVVEKGFCNEPEDVPKRLLFAFIELGEASDAWKKAQPAEVLAEELIDVIFYILDASRLACPGIDMDQMFLKSLRKTRADHTGTEKSTGRNPSSSFKASLPRTHLSLV